MPLFLCCEKFLLGLMKENDLDTHKFFQKCKKLIADFNSESNKLLCDGQSALKKKISCSNRCYICGLLSYGKKKFTGAKEYIQYNICKIWILA